MERMHLREEVHQEPLLPLSKLLCFLLPGPATLIVFLFMARDGRWIAARQAVVYSVFGVLFYTLGRSLLGGL